MACRADVRTWQKRNEDAKVRGEVATNEGVIATSLRISATWEIRSLKIAAKFT